MTFSDTKRTIAFYCDLLGLRLALRKSQLNGDLLFLNAGGGMLEIMVPNIVDTTRSRDMRPACVT